MQPKNIQPPIRKIVVFKSITWNSIDTDTPSCVFTVNTTFPAPLITKSLSVTVTILLSLLSHSKLLYVAFLGLIVASIFKNECELYFLKKEMIDI